MTSLVDRLSDAELRRLADRFTRLGVFPTGFRAPAAPPLVASVGQVGPVALDFPVLGTPVVFTKNWTTRINRTTDVVAGPGLSGSTGLAVPVKAGLLYRALYFLHLATNAASVRLKWLTPGLMFAQWSQGDLGGTYQTAPTDITTVGNGLAIVSLTVKANQDGTIGLDFEANPVGGANIATVHAGSLVDAWRMQ